MGGKLIKANRLVLYVGLFTALLAPACGDSTGTSDQSVVRVTLSGDQTGEFVVSGTADDDPFGLIGSGRNALGHYRIPAEGSTPETVEMVAMRSHPDGTVDMLILWGPSTTGSQVVTEDFAVIIALGLPMGTDGDLDWGAFDSAYSIENGTITVQQISDTRYKGTFTGVGYEWRNGSQIQMLNGTFDIRGESSPGLAGSLCQIAGRC